MEISKDELEMAQNAIQSTIRKCEKVVRTLSMKDSSKQSQVKMMEKRLHVFYVANALLVQALNENSLKKITSDDLEDLKLILPPIKKQIEEMLNKFNDGTSQHTLAVRRIRAFEIVLELSKEKSEISLNLFL